LLVVLLGAISSLLGVLYALSEHDLKRLLAFHSIENVGIILLGLGSALVFVALGLKMLAVLGLIAALYHTLNHAVFKALLFLGAGGDISATHTRNIEQYGGLIRSMPQTAFFFLVGAMAISALPPLNGFFSEWMTYQALFHGVFGSGLLTEVIFILAVGALAFTGGLAAACFVKAFGVTFLARPRSRGATEAREVGGSLRFGMGLLAILTLVFGFFSGFMSKLLGGVAGGLKNIQVLTDTSGHVFNLGSVHVGYATVSMPAVLAGLVVMTLATVLLVAAVSHKQKIREDLTWDCGTDLTPSMEITATGFSRSIITIFKGVLKPSRQTDIEYHDAKLRYFPKFGAVHMELKDVYSAYLYAPLQEFFLKAARQVRKIQNGNVNAYILYMFVTLIVLLACLTT